MAWGDTYFFHLLVFMLLKLRQSTNWIPTGNDRWRGGGWISNVESPQIWRNVGMLKHLFSWSSVVENDPQVKVTKHLLACLWDEDEGCVCGRPEIRSMYDTWWKVFSESSQLLKESKNSYGAQKIRHWFQFWFRINEFTLSRPTVITNKQTKWSWALLERSPAV
jgi:hypothetical protein